MHHLFISNLVGLLTSAQNTLGVGDNTNPQPTHLVTQCKAEACNVALISKSQWYRGCSAPGAGILHCHTDGCLGTSRTAPGNVLGTVIVENKSVWCLRGMSPHSCDVPGSSSTFIVGCCFCLCCLIFLNFQHLFCSQSHQIYILIRALYLS